MKTINNIIILFAAIALFSCNSGKEKKENTEKQVSKEKSYNVNSAIVRWTAYKLSEKVGVSGKFESVNVSPGGSGSVEKLLVNGTFSIPTNTLNSNDTIRDPKIIKTFFGTFNTPDISGKILSAANGSGKVEIKLNEKSQTVDFKYQEEEKALKITAAIDVTNWEGGKASIDALNKVCEAKHTGNDGVSKLWPDVNISVSIPVAE